MSKPPFSLRVLGPTDLQGPTIEDAEGPEALVRQTKRLAILAYLAVATADGFRRRDQVIALFWPELDQPSGRTYLRKALHGIREALGVDLFTTRGEDEVRIDRSKLSCDAVELFEQMAAEHWSEALSLYRGELLEGLFPEGVAQEFQEWLSQQRKRLRESAALAAWKCADAEEARGDRTAAAVMARRARELDPDNEEGVRRLMELLDRRGDRGSALRVYADWQARLMEEFGVEPAPETRKVARRIQAARKGESHETPPVAAPVRAPRVNDAPQPVESPAQSHDEPRRRARPWLLAGSLLMVSAAITVVMQLGRSNPPHPRSVAVAPLRALGTGASTAAEAITEGLQTQLASDTMLVVLSAARVEPEATAFGVEGAVQAGSGTLRLTLRLIRHTDGVTVWAGTYHEPLRETLATAQRLAATAIPELRSRIIELVQQP